VIYLWCQVNTAAATDDEVAMRLRSALRFLHLLFNTFIALSAISNSRMLTQAKPVYVFVLECHRMNQKQGTTGLVSSETSPTYRRHLRRYRTDLARRSRAMVVTLPPSLLVVDDG